MKFSVRASYPENVKYNWLEAVKTYEEIGFVEVAFLDPELFLATNEKDIVIPFKNTSIEVSQLMLLIMDFSESNNSIVWLLNYPAL